MEIAKYILSIFKYYPSIIMSWGFHNAVAIDNGLRFSVQGYIHTGKVEVIYDEGADLFNVRILNIDGTIKQEENGIFLDELVDIIDRLVEKCPNYDQKVKETYGF